MIGLVVVTCAYLLAVHAQQECVVNLDDLGNEWGLCGSTTSPDGKDYDVETAGMTEAVAHTISLPSTAGLYNETSSQLITTNTTTTTTAGTTTATYTTLTAAASSPEAASSPTIEGQLTTTTTTATTNIATNTTQTAAASSSTAASSTTTGQQLTYTFSRCTERCVSYLPYWVRRDGGWWPVSHYYGVWRQYLSWCWCSTNTCGYYYGLNPYWEGKCGVNYGYQRVLIWHMGQLVWVWVRLGTGCCCRPNINWYVK